MNATSPFSSHFMKNYITFIKIIIIPIYSPLHHISNYCSYYPIEYLILKLWLPKKSIFTELVHIFTGAILLEGQLLSNIEENT
jgi:hypothetical protein